MALADDLICYYSLDNTLNDSMGTYNLSSTDTANDASGKINQGRSHSSTATSKLYVTVTPADVGGSSNFSVSLWFKCTSFRYNDLINRIDNPGNASGFRIFTSPDATGQIYFWIRATGAGTVVSDTPVVGAYNSGAWHHVVMTYDGSWLNGWYDGTRICHKAGSITIGTVGTVLGSGITGGNGFDGSLDEVGIWKRTLSDAEIASLYNSGSGFAYPFVVVVTPVASYTASVTSGYPPLSVTFTDTSTNTPTSWSWEKDNVVFSTNQNPVEVFDLGTYDIKLTVTNTAGSDAEEKLDYITVTPKPITILPMSGTKHRFSNSWKFSNRWKFKFF